MRAAEAKPAAVIIDIDGTVANCRHRQHFLAGKTPNWEAFFAGAALDESLPESIALANEHARDSIVIWLTGRPERYRRLTTEWLMAQGLPTANLHLPPDDDMRPVSMYKAERLTQPRGSEAMRTVIAGTPAHAERLVVAALAGPANRPLARLERRRSIRGYGTQ